MSYMAMSALTLDQYFKQRLNMCVAEQAKGYIDDPEPANNLLASQAIGNVMSVTEQMLPLVATQPGMTSDSTDGDIMAAVQYLWPIVGGRLVPPPPVYSEIP